MFNISTIARRWPFANGSGRIVDLLGTRVNVGSGRRVAETSDGFSMQVFADDLIGRHLLMTGEFDRSVVQVLLDRSRPGDTLLDIGANIGYFSAVFLSNVEDSNTICFEPQPGVVDLLKANVGQFAGRSRVHQVGLADKDDELRFHIDTVNRGASRISSDGENVIPVLDAQKVFAGIDHLDLIKIDVEGYEEPIFRSIENELRRLKPRAIVFEDQTQAAAPTGPIGATLDRAGFRVLGIHKRLFETKLVPIHSQSDCRFNDYLAEPRS